MQHLGLSCPRPHFALAAPAAVHLARCARCTLRRPVAFTAPRCNRCHALHLRLFATTGASWRSVPFTTAAVANADCLRCILHPRKSKRRAARPSFYQMAYVDIKTACSANGPFIRIHKRAGRTGILLKQPFALEPFVQVFPEHSGRNGHCRERFLVVDAFRKPNIRGIVISTNMQMAWQSNALLHGRKCLWGGDCICNDMTTNAEW